MKRLGTSKKSVAIFVWVWTVYTISVQLSSREAEIEECDDNTSCIKSRIATLLLAPKLLPCFKKQRSGESLLAIHVMSLHTALAPAISWLPLKNEQGKKMAQKKHNNEEEHCTEEEDETGKESSEENLKKSKYAYSRKRRRKKSQKNQQLTLDV